MESTYCIKWPESMPSTKSGLQRWSIQTFCNMLELAGINSAIFCKEVTGEKLSRKYCLLF